MKISLRVKKIERKKPIELFGILKNIKLDPMEAKNLTKEAEKYKSLPVLKGKAFSCKK